MGLTAENLAEKYSISREEQDGFALRSQQFACRAVKDGRFKEEITPVLVPTRKGGTEVFDRDEYPKADTSLEKLARLPAVFKKAYYKEVSLERMNQR